MGWVDRMALDFPLQITTPVAARNNGDSHLMNESGILGWWMKEKGLRRTIDSLFSMRAALSTILDPTREMYCASGRKIS